MSNVTIVVIFFFSSRRRHTRWTGDWSSDVCSSDLRDQRHGAAPRADVKRGSPGSEGVLRHERGITNSDRQPRTWVRSPDASVLDAEGATARARRNFGRVSFPFELEGDIAAVALTLDEHGRLLLGSVVRLQSYDDISFLAPGVDVAVSLGDLLEGIAPINDRSEFSRLSQLREKTQVLYPPGCRSSDDFLAADHRHPRDLKHVWQPT